MVKFLERDQILSHTAVIGELMLGNLKMRKVILQNLFGLQAATPASDLEVIDFIEHHRLYGQGIGFVDAHLLASAKLSAAVLWTNDKRLRVAAEKLELAL